MGPPSGQSYGIRNVFLPPPHKKTLKNRCRYMKKGVLLFMGWMLVACSDINNCDSDSNQTFMIVRFFDFESKSSQKISFQITDIETGTAFVPSTDSLAVGLPLDPLDTAVLFQFDLDTTAGIDYVLHVRYDPVFSIFDPNCDPSLFFAGLDTLTSSFDSTAIHGVVTNRQLTTNFEVYF